MNNLILPTIFLVTIAGARAAFKAPGWKHCIHPLHAMPNQWSDIKSPGFPTGINTQIQCSWVIQANPGYRIKLAFHTLNVTGSKGSCYTQFVEILDYKVGHTMGKFCGTSRPGDYVSYGQKLRFDLQGDTSGEKTKGFDVRFKATRDTGGWQQKWSFSDTKKPNRKSKRKGKKKAKGGPKVPPKTKKTSSGPSPPRGAQPPRAAQPPRGAQPPPGATSPQDKEEAPAKSPKPKPKAPAAPAKPVGQKPLQPYSSNKRIDYSPSPQKNGRPVFYGANNNVRGVDHGQSNVITMNTKEEEPFNIYIIIGIAAGGVVALIVIAILVKVCIIDKNHKRKKRNREQLEREKAAREEPEHFHMTPLPGAVPEQYMTEQIMPQLQSYPPHMQPMPMMTQTMSHHYPPGMYPQQMHGEKYRTAPPMMAPPRDAKSSRSRARSQSRSRVSRNGEMQRSKSRSSVRGSRSRSSMRRSRSRRSISRNSMRRSRSRPAHPPPQMGPSWVTIDPRYQQNVKTIPYPPRSVVESSDLSSSSSDLGTDSSDSYDESRRRRRSKRASSLPRMQSHPPPYESAVGKHYYVERSRDFDEGYDTGKRTTGSRSMASKKEKNSKKSKKQKSKKYSY